MTNSKYLEKTFSVLSDPETANLERPVSSSSYQIYDSYCVENEILKFSRDAKKSEVTPSRGMLESFVKLADATDEEIRRYACKYGVLHLCKEHLTPAGHNHQCQPMMMWHIDLGVGASEVTFKEGEPLKIWRKYANYAQGLMNISRELHEGKLGRKKDCLRTQLNYFDDPNYVENYADSNEREKAIVKQKQYVDYAVNYWLAQAAVRPVFFWENERPEITFESNYGYGKLFGNLAIQLMMAISQTKGLAICSSCGKFYNPQRRPREGKRRYCEDCGSKAAIRDASAAYRKRKKDSSQKL